MKESLPGISRIFYLPCSSLHPMIAIRAKSGMPIGIFSYLHPIDKVGVAYLEKTSELVNNGRTESAELKFTTLDVLPDIPLAFLAKCVNGKSYIIGAREKPYPEVKVTETVDGTTAVMNYVVTFSAEKACVEVAVSLV